MSRGFTKTGQPIQGRRYIMSQEPDVPSTEVRLVGKLYGPGGNADLVGVILEGPNGGRDTFPWPIVATEGTPDITFQVAP